MTESPAARVAEQAQAREIADALRRVPEGRWFTLSPNPTAWREDNLPIVAADALDGLQQRAEKAEQNYHEWREEALEWRDSLTDAEDELVAVREDVTRLREALEQIADESECSIGLKAVEAHGDTFCAYHVARAALVVSSPPPGAPLTEPEGENSTNPETRRGIGAGTGLAAATAAGPGRDDSQATSGDRLSGSVSVSPPPGERAAPQEASE